MDTLKKMTTELKDVVSYSLKINEKSHIMNDLIDSCILNVHDLNNIIILSWLSECL